MKNLKNGMLRRVGSLVSGMTLVASMAVLSTAAPASAATEQCADYDHGTYHEYAGPVNTLGPSAGRCVEAFTWIKVGSRLGEVDITGHCG